MYITGVYFARNSLLTKSGSPWMIARARLLWQESLLNDISNTEPRNCLSLITNRRLKHLKCLFQSHIYGYCLI